MFSDLQVWLFGLACFITGIGVGTELSEYSRRRLARKLKEFKQKMQNKQEGE